MKQIDTGRVGVPPAVFRVSRNTRQTRCDVAILSTFDVLRETRSTAGETPTLPRT